ncbi:MAG: DUF1761 domain-containing protein [Anaeromyxobacteraceae bacterium]
MDAMGWGRFLLAVLVAGLASSMTDWLFGGVLFHEKYKAFPEVWRNAGGAAERNAILASVALSFLACAAFALAVRALDITGWSRTLLLAVLTWAAGPLPTLATNGLFIKLHPSVIASNSIGWLVKLMLAASATVLLFR